MSRGSVVQRPSGNYGIRYYAGGRRRYETIGPNRREAEDALAARLGELVTGAWRAPSKETLAVYARRWLEQRRGRLASSTFVEYERALEKRILPELGDRPLVSLQTVDVDELIRGLENELAAGTVRNTITPLRSLLTDAVRQGKIVTNPAARADLPPANEFAGREIPFEHTDAIRAALVELARPDPLREGEPDLFYAWLVDVALGTGLRLGELRALRWRDVDYPRRLIRVERAYSRRELGSTKSRAGIRSVPLFGSLEPVLRSLEARAFERGRAGLEELVFSTEHGTALHESNLNRRVWKEALKRAAQLIGEEASEARLAGDRARADELDESAAALAAAGYRWHELRHTCVSRLVAAGADVKLVQAVAGHANPMITLQRYSHLLDTRVTEAAERFDPLVAPARSGH